MTLRRLLVFTRAGFGLLVLAVTMTAVTVTACSASSSSGGDQPDASMAGDTQAPGDDAALCPDDLPASCPSPIPSYKTEIAPILANYCVTCHSPTGCCGYSELTYAEVANQASSILDQVYGCTMPPATSHMLSLDQRQALLGWLVCNAPNN
jgi:hypothetical protein